MKTESKITPGGRRIAIIAAILGGIFGFVGLFAGLYVGVLKPALASGGSLHFPIGLWVGTASLILAVLVGVAWQVWRYLHRRRMPAEDAW